MKNFPRAMLMAIGLSLALTASAQAQPGEALRSLSLDTVWLRVLEHHPVARQAALLSAEAAAVMREARGGFDPKLFSDGEQKFFKSTEYYTFTESGLKIPSWYGLEFKGVFQTASGANIDPEHALPAAGQAVVGVKASLLRGMVIDERRAALQQARLLEDANAAERENILNNLLMDAVTAYWEWWASYQQLEVFRRALDNARQRQTAIVLSFIQGDKPAIDTVESFVQLQSRQLEWQQANLDFRNAGLQLANFLWQDGEIPLELEENTAPGPALQRPEAVLAPQVALWLETLEQQHPELRMYQLKLSGLDIDRRLAREQLKPRLDLDYNFLGNGFDLLGRNGNDNGIPAFLTDNYKLGISFEMPLFLRKERGKLQQTELKILNTDYDLRQKRQLINNKVLAYYNEWENIRQQLELYQETLTGYRQLLDAEQQKFRLGESSVFLINSRENKLIEAELKGIQLEAKRLKLEAAVQWAAGRLAAAF